VRVFKFKPEGWRVHPAMMPFASYLRGLYGEEKGGALWRRIAGQ